MLMLVYFGARSLLCGRHLLWVSASGPVLYTRDQIMSRDQYAVYSMMLAGLTLCKLNDILYWYGPVNYAQPASACYGSDIVSKYYIGDA
jgi:hypothetical protein